MRNAMQSHEHQQGWWFVTFFCQLFRITIWIYKYFCCLITKFQICHFLAAIGKGIDWKVLVKRIIHFDCIVYKICCQYPAEYEMV